MKIDRDLLAIQEVRDACQQAKAAQLKFKTFTQKQVDRVVAAMYEAGFAAAESLARLAVNETGFGRYEDKVVKNQFATRNVFEYIRPLKTVGRIGQEGGGTISKIAEPMGVVAGIIPSTNPTSTTLFKALIAVKSRNSIVFSPHPNAIGCVSQAAQVMKIAAEKAGAPTGLIQCLSYGLMPATTELMQHPDVAVILATGGAGLVKAAYSAGKPAFGVGPGNVPAFIERTADVSKAVADIVLSKTFDNGTVCASEQSVVVEAPLEARVVQEFQQRGAYFLAPAESEKLAQVLVTPKLTVNPALVGQSATVLAKAAGITVPEHTSLLMSRESSVGSESPLTVEKLSPVLAFFVEPDWHAGCERCIQLLQFGGLGHTLVIHSKNEEIINEFALKKPAFRILVNTPSTHGAIGLTTNLAPSLTLGCGTFGGNITADNVTPMHLMNIKRLAYESRPAANLPGASVPEKSEFPYQKALEPWNTRKFTILEEQKIMPDAAATAAAPDLAKTGLNEIDVEKIVQSVVEGMQKQG